MDMHIGEMNSTVRVTDGQSRISQQELDRITREVLVRLRDHQTREQRRQDDVRVSNTTSISQGEAER
jgi:hypothetical protein